MTRPAALFLCAVLAFGHPRAASAQSVLRLAVPAIPTTLDPHRAVTSAEMMFAREHFLGLTAHDAEGRIAPGLAESWTVSPDALTYVLTLREGLRWSDGKAIDAGVIVKSLERALDPATAAPFAAPLMVIRNAEGFRLGTLPAGAKLAVTARDRRTVEIQLSQPSQGFLQVLAQPLAAAVPVHRIAAKQPWADAQTLIGSGAYLMAPSPEGAVLKRNPEFYAAAAFDAVEVRALATLEAAVADIREGRIDLALGFTPEPRPRGAARAVVEGENLEVYQFIVNAAHPPLDKLELRHALGMVIDRAELIKDLRLADAEPIFNLVAQAPYSIQRAPYARLQRADRRVVAEALLLDTDIPAARPLKLIHPSGALHRAVAEAAAASWRGLGFKVEVTALDEAAHERAALDGNFDVAVTPPWRRAAGVESVLFIFGQTAGPWNAARYRELTFDQFMADADAEPSAEFYPSFQRQAEGVLIEDQIAWPVLAFPAAVATHAKFTGLAPNPAHIHPLRLLSPAKP